MFIRSLLAPLSFALLATTAVGQGVSMAILDRSTHSFGVAVASMGDLNGDGYGDVAVGSLWDPYNTASATATVEVHSFEGPLLYLLSAQPPDRDFGTTLFAGDDIDGDGKRELFVGDPTGRDPNTGIYPGFVRAFSGRTGATLFTIYGVEQSEGFGRAMADAGDWDHDGTRDVLIAAPSATGGVPTAFGRLVVVSGRTGATLFAYTNAIPSGQLGSLVASLGDLDSDGTPDVAASLWHPVYSLPTMSCVAISGRTGAQLWLITPIMDFESVAGLGDVDGDGVGDLAFGEPQYAWGWGRVEVFGGATGTLLRTFPGSRYGARLGETVASAGDVNGDGLADLFMTGSDRFQIVSVLGTWPGISSLIPYESGNSASCAAGDVDRDGRPDFFLTHGHFTLAPSTTVPAMSSWPTNPSRAGAESQLFLLNAPAFAGASYFVLGSASGTTPGVNLGSVTIPLNPDWYTTASFNSPLLPGATGVLNGAGQSRVPVFQLGPLVPPAAVGLLLHHAFIAVASNGGMFASNAVSTYITP